MWCEFCGEVDEYYDENSDADHDATPKHLCNVILHNYKENKKNFSKNRDGVIIFASAESKSQNGAVKKVDKTDNHKIRIYVKPNQVVKFTFSITNDMKNEALLVVGFQLAHPQPQFTMNQHRYIFGKNPHILEKKSSIKDEISITFVAADIGQYEMPIMFTFHRRSDEKNLIFIREMVVMVQDEIAEYHYAKSPYINQEWEKADDFIVSTTHIPYMNKFKIPPLLKTILPRGLNESAIETFKGPTEVRDKLRQVLVRTRAIFDEGITQNNYMVYFRHLLWWEEIVSRINLRKYNMSGVNLGQKGDLYSLEVPGLSENRPSLLRGDRVFIRIKDSPKVVFESNIKDIDENLIYIANLDERFVSMYRPDTLYDIRFLMSRVPCERMHEAVAQVFEKKQDNRLFPVARKAEVKLKPIYRWYNPLIRDNEEQRSAVQHILSGTSKRAPYMVFGPPGTGKTMTIVEAIIQIVLFNSKNRVLVCTDSNMAADHIALMLMRYNKTLNIHNFIIRANSQSRVWTVMPAELGPVSNGTNYTNWFTVSNRYICNFRIVVTTLLHAAKYASSSQQQAHQLKMSHLFIDEAGQASEPASLVPITGLLAHSGQLVLAGDPRQLGPVCISREANTRGLGTSLMERLKTDYANLYGSDPNYITMLKKNFRNNPDILRLPNELFYENNLVPLAPSDPLSETSILGMEGGARAVVFHAVNSREQKMGNAPSYFNEKELEMLKKYTKALIQKHGVTPKDIGVIAPYIRQVYKMKGWLMSENFEDIEVGTVESFQGKEKRVILVSTVRANCRLLDYDAKYGLGFLVDDKRFNVTLTRAKAKLIIIGNPACLSRDEKWRKYMNLCKDLGCYHGQESEQIARTSLILREIAKTRFNRCLLTDCLKQKADEQNKKSKNKKK